LEASVAQFKDIEGNQIEELAPVKAVAAPAGSDAARGLNLGPAVA
jgi:hypothetical protein